MGDAAAGPDLLDPDTFVDGPPHAIFDQLRDGDPVYGQPNPVNGGVVWSLTRFADIRAVSTDTERFTSSLGVQYPTPAEEVPARHDNLVWHDPPRHTRSRSYAAMAFSPRVVARFADWIRDLSIKILDQVEEEGTIDAIPTIAAELPGQVITTIIGVPAEDRHTIIGLANEFFGRLEPEIGMERAMAAPDRIRAYMKELSLLRAREPAVDMMTELVSATYEGEPIAESELTELAATLVMAGFETTHTLIAQGLVLMAQDPDVRRQVEEASTEQMGAVVDEMLRYVSPIMHMARAAKADLEFGGKRIAKGDRVLLWYAAGNRDPGVFDDPHRFDGARGRRNHLAFGVGPHFCLGNHLARLEAEILFDEMRKRGVRLELDGEPRRARGLFVNGVSKLPMRVAR